MIPAAPPFNPVLNQSHPLAQKLVGAWLLTDRATLPRNHVRTGPDFATNDGTWVANGVHYPGGGTEFGSILYGNSSVGSRITMVLTFTPIAVGTTLTMMSWGDSVTDGFPYIISQFTRTYINNGWNITYSGGLFVAGRPNTYIITSPTDNYWYVYVNGAAAGTPYLSANPVREDLETTIFVGRGFGGSPNMIVHSLLVFDRGMYPAEARQLSRDPYLFFRPPPTRIGLSVAPANTTVALSWTDNSVGETGYSIERSTDGINYSEIGTAAADATSYNDETAVPATTYYYRVKATGSPADSDYSNVATITTA